MCKLLNGNFSIQQKFISKIQKQFELAGDEWLIDNSFCQVSKFKWKVDFRPILGLLIFQPEMS